MTQPKKPLMAVTLHRPWPYAITDLEKGIENRPWRCHLTPGDLLAIHAGKAWDEEAVGWIESVFRCNLGPEDQHPLGIIAICTFAGNITESEDPWFVGPIGWQLQDVTPIVPVPCGGAQRLWRVQDPVLRQVRINYHNALHGGA